jgi:hypothetical protein
MSFATTWIFTGSGSPIPGTLVVSTRERRSYTTMQEALRQNRYFGFPSRVGAGELIGRERTADGKSGCREGATQVFG